MLSVLVVLVRRLTPLVRPALRVVILALARQPSVALESKSVLRVEPSVVAHHRVLAALRLVQSVALAVASLDRERHMLTQAAHRKDSQEHTAARVVAVALVPLVLAVMPV